MSLMSDHPNVWSSFFLAAMQNTLPETKPVFRLRNGAEHFYTIDPAERDSAIANYGYTYEGIAFYCHSEMFSPQAALSAAAAQADAMLAEYASRL